MGRRGRAAVLWGLGLYAVAQLLLVFFFVGRCDPLLLATWRFKCKQLRHLLARVPDRPLLVMLGSSRTAMAFEAASLNGPDTLNGPDGKPFLVYNCGIPMIGPIQEWLCLREMLEAGVRPRLLVIELVPALMNEPSRGLNSEEQWTASPWLSLREGARLWPYFARPTRKGRDWLQARLAPCYVFRSELESWLMARWFPQLAPPPRTFPHDAWGHQQWLAPAQSLHSQVKVHDMYEESLGHFRLARGASQAMRDMVAHCRREQIPVVVVHMPESSEFRNWYPPEGVAAVRRLLAELHDDYGADVLDANEWLADQYFIDGHHVLPEGARVFTTRLAAELRRILERGGAGERLAARKPH